MYDREYFTVVFRGNLSQVNGNPFKKETPFGKPVGVSFGDALAELDIFKLRAERDREVCDHCGRNKRRADEPSDF